MLSPAHNLFSSTKLFSSVSSWAQIVLSDVNPEWTDNFLHQIIVARVNDREDISYIRAFRHLSLMAVVYIRRSGLATPTLSTLTTKSKKSPRTGTVDFSRVKPLFSSIRQIWPQLFIRQISNTKKNNHWWLITSYLSYLLASYLSLCGFFSVVVAWRDGYWESKWEAILSWCYDSWPKDCIVTFSNFQ